MTSLKSTTKTTTKKQFFYLNALGVFLRILATIAVCYSNEQNILKSLKKRLTNFREMLYSSHITYEFAMLFSQTIVLTMFLEHFRVFLFNNLFIK